MIVVPDTSVVIDGRFSQYIRTHEIEEIVIPEAVVAEIEHQANVGKSSGDSGLRELVEIRNLCESNAIQLSFYGNRPSATDIHYAHEGAVDNIIRNVASDLDATLVTGDSVQAKVAQSKGISTVFLEQYGKSVMRIEDFFDELTMSVHLKAGLPVLMKKGRPGNMQIVKDDKVLSELELEDIAIDIIERAKNTRDCFIEMDEPGATVVQLVDFRIAITKPPFSDRFEITAVHPVKKVSLEEYGLTQKLEERLESAEGILVAGAPGAGKSTFVQALAEHYNDSGRIVKTMEKPRDLQVSDEITQYTALSGDMAKTGDILLLVRPDFTIFDEMRKTDDFRVFSDLRLAGVGMIGVVHATRTIDAIQRFIGRIELGVIPQLVDTVIQIKGGEVSEVFTVRFKVKVPSGMTESDLARPVIEVFDNESGALTFEIYTFGEQVVVMQVEESKRKAAGADRLAIEAIKKEIRKVVPGTEFEVEMKDRNRAVIYTDPQDVPYIIGKKGKVVTKLENRLGIKLDVVGETPKNTEIQVNVKVMKKYIHLAVDAGYTNKTLRFFLGDEELFTSTVGKKGIIKIERKSDYGYDILEGFKMKKFIYAIPV